MRESIISFLGNDFTPLFLILLFFLYLFFKQLIVDIGRLRAEGLSVWAALSKIFLTFEVERSLAHRPGNPQNEMYELEALDGLPRVAPARKHPQNPESASIGEAGRRAE